MGKKQKARRIGSKIHNKINRIRQSRDRARLTGDSTLRQQAENYAREMAKRDKVGHHVDGSSPQSRYSGSGNSENCAYVHDKGSTSKTADEVVSNWMNSPGHRQNILRKSSSYDGVGVWFRRGKVYVAHAFARRRLRTPDVSADVDLQVRRRVKHAARSAHRLTGRALETPYAPLRALNPSWWQILPRRRQRSLTVGIVLGALGAWLVFQTALLRGLPTSVYVIGTEVPLLWLLVGLVAIAEVVRYRR